MGLNKHDIHPNPNIKSVCYIQNVVNQPNIVIGDYTYYSDDENCLDFVKHVTHHYPFYGDKLIIGKFCAIAKGVEFIMNGANHQMNSITTYPFGIVGIESAVPKMSDLPYKGDTVIGNDVWIGQNVTFMPGVHVGNGAIIAANSVVSGDIPSYSIFGGNPAKFIKQRFSDDIIQQLEELAWWNLDETIIEQIIPFLLDSRLDLSLAEIQKRSQKRAL